MYSYTDKIESKRLRTRFLNIEDIAGWAGFLSEPECTRYFPLSMKGNPEESAAAWIEKQLKRYREKRYGLQAILEKTTGNWIGQCGLLLQQVDEVNELEVGYHLFRKYWGNGYAREIAKAFFDHGFRNSDTSSIISIIHTENEASMKVALANGLKAEKETIWNEIPVRIFRIGRQEFYDLNPALLH